MTIRVACIGEAMIELRPRGDVADIGVAGDTLNTAIYLKRCAPQIDVDFITRLGTDPFSDRIAAFIAAQGVGTDGIACDPAGTPGLYSIAVADDGERSFQYWRSASAARDLYADGVIEGLAEYDLVYLSGISLAILTETARRALLDYMETHGVKLAYDNNYRPRLWPSRQIAHAACDAFLNCADIALLSLDDEIDLTGESEAQIVARLETLPVIGALKRGPRGPVCLGDHVLQDYPSAATMVDSTAAGDSFNGAYLAARLTGKPQAEALMAGHDMAMQVVQHPGAILPK